MYAPQENVSCRTRKPPSSSSSVSSTAMTSTADFVEHSAPPGFASNRTGVKEMFGAFLAAFPDMHLRIDDVIVEGDKVVMRATATGTHKGPFMGIPATNKSFSINEIHIVQVRGEQCVAHWGVVDMVAMMRQIGVMPPPGNKL